MPQEMPEAQEPQSHESPAELAMKVSGELAQLMELTEDDTVKQQLQSTIALLNGMGSEEENEPQPMSEAKSKGYVSANGGPKGVPVQ